MNTHKLPIGVDNFHKLVSSGYLFCDKTAMIADLLKNGEEVTLITRPRRWGKTLNMSMLHHFFASEVNGVRTAGLFDNLAIGSLEGGRYIREHQGKHPVIMISFKDVNADNFQGAYNAVYELILEVYSSYAYLLKSDAVNEIQFRQLHTILSKEANQQALEKSLKLLSQCLYQHHGQKVYMLIDEYDTPLNKAYGDEVYLKAMVALMRNLFSAGLKSNTALEKGVLTGILRVSKDSMLSGLNNLETYTLLDEAYSSYFGFSETEASYLFKAKDLGTSMEEVRHWYNGYRVGNLVMYNPWSIISCMNRSGCFDVYWVNTGNNNLIEQKVLSSHSEIKAQFEQLMRGESLAVSINKHLAFDILDKDDASFWSLLLFAGYLTFETSHLSAYTNVYDCTVKVPNYEIWRLYSTFFQEWFVNQFERRRQYDSFLKHLVAGEVASFVEQLGYFLRGSVSYFDSYFDTKQSKTSEGFYHGFVLGMLSSLGITYYIRSNRESGLGRYDLLLISKKEGSKALLLEFKQVRKEEELETAAKLALSQIQIQAYHTEILQYPYVQEVVEVGIAFSGKSVVAAYATYDLAGQQAGDVLLTNRYGQCEERL
ncbi:MAG: ATP-binding protein [Candidatus Cardinium sp.]|uniref:AAA family ATPase n=1 Tax=Cardinium endosymbiont of Dermatophagoides farinae TaxID=2597823 RepID=UPI001183860F|nr:AAA family ATPase [Cardinium endosymbiont of Dermatophagoides farinae]TSJ81238.1 9-O-acetyl-N-acetylneuraminate esterase [Cardinium endosymbiont of Dermatophagoides farinae]UWW97291.1 MAG: ATP-binding protein [Candidatus Cardinium sp.]